MHSPSSGRPSSDPRTMHGPRTMPTMHGGLGLGLRLGLRLGLWLELGLEIEAQLELELDRGYG